MRAIEVDFICSTNGQGYWNSVQKDVHSQLLKLHISDLDGKKYAELCVYFNLDTWNIQKDGLIYTDPLWLEELKRQLHKIIGSANVSYSEQGMQGYDYVSLDTSPEFIWSWIKLFVEKDPEKYLTDSDQDIRELAKSLIEIAN